MQFLHNINHPLWCEMELSQVHVCQPLHAQFDSSILIRVSTMVLSPLRIDGMLLFQTDRNMADASSLLGHGSPLQNKARYLFWVKMAEHLIHVDTYLCITRCQGCVLHLHGGYCYFKRLLSWLLLFILYWLFTGI